MLKWKKRLPRKPRAKSQALPQRVVQRVRKTLAPRPPRLLLTGCHDRQEGPKSKPRQHAPDAIHRSSTTSRVARLQAGRTNRLALQLAAFHVFKPMKYLQANTVVPSRGLSARLWQTQEPHPWVFIVDTFSRWGKQLADVAVVLDSGRLGRVRTVERDLLSQTCLRFKVKQFQRGVALVEEAFDLNVTDVPVVWGETKCLADKLHYAQQRLPPTGSGPEPTCDLPVSVTPLAAELHGRMLGHTVQKRDDKGASIVLWFAFSYSVFIFVSFYVF